MNKNSNIGENLTILIEKIEKDSILKDELENTDFEIQDILIKEAIKLNKENAFKTIVKIWLDDKYKADSIPVEYILQKNAKECLIILKEELPTDIYIYKLKKYFNVPFLFNHVDLGLYLEHEIKAQEKNWSSVKDYKEILLEAIDLENKEVFSLLMDKDYILSDEKLLNYGHKLSILKENDFYLTINQKAHKNFFAEYSKEDIREQLLKAIYKDKKNAVEVYLNNYSNTIKILEDLYPEAIEKLSIKIIGLLVEKQIPISEEALESLEKIKNSKHIQANDVYTLITKTQQYQKLDNTLKEEHGNKKRVKL